MARIRSIKPEIHMDEAVGALSDSAYRLFTGLITQADDHGRQKGSPQLLSSLIWPYQGKPAAEVTELLRELESHGLIIRYFHDGEEVTELVTWREFVVDIGRTTIPKRVRQAVEARDGRVCRLCGGEIPVSESVHLDHIIPFSRGGADTVDNLQVAHARCNIAKGASF